MEIKYSPVTYADRITALSNQNSLQKGNGSSITSGVILGLTLTVLITAALVKVYYTDKMKGSQLFK